MKLQSIAKEAAACRAAWAAAPDASVAWHLHHEVLAEPLKEPAENRIAYILTDKPTEEQALRLRLFRPMIGELPQALVKAWAASDKARAACVKAAAAYDKARAAYAKAWAAYAKARAAYDKARAAYAKAWAAYDKAWAASDKAWAAYVKARAAYDKAWAAYAKAWAAYDKAWAASDFTTLHATECLDCPWDGRSIFG